jgi:hypothetical protein
LARLSVQKVIASSAPLIARPVVTSSRRGNSSSPMTLRRTYRSRRSLYTALSVLAPLYGAVTVQTLVVVSFYPQLYLTKKMS